MKHITALKWNVGGILQERKSNIRRNMSTDYQLHRMKFKSRPNISYKVLSDNGKEIYDALIIRYRFGNV